MQRSYVMNPVILGMHNQTKFEPQRTNHFEVFIKLPTSITTSLEELRSWQEWLTLSTSDFSLPSITVSPIEIPYGNTKIKVAGNVEFGGADSLTCTDFIGADVEKILYTWQNQIYNPETGQMGWAANYKADAKVLEYSADGACLSSWILFGVWPSAVNYGSSMSKGDSQVKSVSVTLSYDLAYRKYGTSSDRAQHEQAAAAAATNMRWKDHDEYAGSNSGGPLNLDSKPGSFIEPFND